MAKILICASLNSNLVSIEGEYICLNKVNKQKVRRALGGRPAGTECGNSCSCS